ncbi:hypothetical protein AB0F96_31905 [Streptomyces sp. NPDC023998]|uniref:hypothetical protein n=1 Tax=Streptomyces sp. NPDC023998 TaxID=3154597 RepID=UPI0033EF2B64
MLLSAVCCLLFTLLPVVWLLAASILPEQVFWYPIWLGAVIWNGMDGQGGISHLIDEEQAVTGRARSRTH